MSLITLNINLTRLVEATERIAVCLERAFPLPEFHETKKRGPEALIKNSPVAQWEREQLRERKRIREEEGLPPKEEKSQQ
jgi:hypothetical protein